MQFYKYQGTGNDFIMLDQRQKTAISPQDKAKITALCNRRFGIGSDGIVILQNHLDYDFEMIFYNPDGSQSMCGNGGRCAVAFAKQLRIIDKNCRFLAIDGPHEAKIKRTGKGLHWVELKMKSIQNVENQGDTFVINTGSPHYVQFVNKLEGQDITATGKSIRYNQRFKKEGINVNLVQINKKGIEMLTYERGVEAETLSCGTGVTAAALATALYRNIELGKSEMQVITKGGKLSVKMEKMNQQSFENIWLCGPAQRVFSGSINL
jgi:diaminopimelate epimerase